MKVDGSNAVQILLLLGGVTLVPALLFTVTGFARIDGAAPGIQTMAGASAGAWPTKR